MLNSVNSTFELIIKILRLFSCQNASSYTAIAQSPKNPAMWARRYNSQPHRLENQVSERMYFVQNRKIENRAESGY